MRRDAGRIRLDQADDKVGVVDGSDRIKNQIQRQSLPLDDLGWTSTTCQGSAGKSAPLRVAAKR